MWVKYIRELAEDADLYGLKVSPVLSIQYIYYPRKDKQKAFEEAKAYTQKVVGAFANDSRIVLWDIWNEPNYKECPEMYEQMDWIEAAVGWCREMFPIQPITSSIFYDTIDRNRIEVYDLASDVVIYDIENHEIFTTAALFSDDSFESFPTFSPDGKTLYFSTAEAREMPDEYEKVKYSICSISFDSETKKFGALVDTIFNAILENKSASFPRVSPNGKYLLYTKGDYGGFFVWHKEADLCIYNIKTEKHYPLTLANSNDSESYHSWSSNSRWIVYSSRRIDGLYTRPFIAYINDKGEAEKAFVVPQKDVGVYDYLMKSYNVPEFIKSKVEVTGHDIAHVAKTNRETIVKFNSTLTD